MKKHLFFLIVAFLAVTSAFGQLVPRTINCTVSIAGGALTPALGKEYVYSVDVSNDGVFTGSPSLTYQWFVTKNPAFITAGVVSTDRTTAVLNTDFAVAAGTYDAATASNEDITISWKTTATEAAPFFLVVNVVGQNGVCDPMNMKVYKIVPLNMFTLDIANVDVLNSNAILGYDVATAQCYQDIQSVTWKTNTDEAIYDYGTNTLIWAVAAANWSTSWTPSLQFTGINAGERVESVTWSRTPTGAADGTFNLSSGTYTTSDVVEPATTGVTTIDEAGETIYIRLVLDHTDPGTSTFFEGIIDQTITLAVDGVTALGDGDVHYSNTLPAANADCGLEDGFKYDVSADQTLKQRPAVDTTTPTTPEPFLTPVAQ